MNEIEKCVVKKSTAVMLFKGQHQIIFIGLDAVWSLWNDNHFYPLSYKDSQHRKKRLDFKTEKEADQYLASLKKAYKIN